MATHNWMPRNLSSSKVARALAGEELGDREVLPLDEGITAREEGRFVFECAWEVANKCMYGRWLIDGYPKVILFDLASGSNKMDEWKHELFERCRIGIPHEDIESNDAVILGFMVAIFLRHFRDAISGYQPLVAAHFHEWQAGLLLYYKYICTIFWFRYSSITYREGYIYIFLKYNNYYRRNFFQNLHSIAKEKIHNFIRGHFHGHLDFDLDKTVYFFTAGRFFFPIFMILQCSILQHLFPAPANSFNVESLKGQAVTKQLKEVVDRIKENVGQRIFDICLQGHLPEEEDLLSSAERIQSSFLLYRLLLVWITKTLFVVVILEYFLRTMNHGGKYTPAECTVMGIPSISTNLSGFGCFMQEHVEDPASYGIYVVDRRFKSAEDSILQLAQIMYDFCGMSRRQRIIQRNRTERLSELLDWNSLGVFYSDCRRQALEKLHPELNTIIRKNEGMVPSAATSRRPSVHSSDEEN
uniref:Glycogen [starch] synthase n=1 Tax=Heterorhabditis bacteriophora TaxID=37862 RepID=A0A1I7XUN9_HETBA